MQRTPAGRKVEREREKGGGGGGRRGESEGGGGGGGPGEHGRRRPSAAVSRLLPPHRHRRFLCALGDVAEPLVGVTLNPETVRVYAATFCLFSPLSLSLFSSFSCPCACVVCGGGTEALGRLQVQLEPKKLPVWSPSGFPPEPHRTDLEPHGLYF